MGALQSSQQRSLSSLGSRATRRKATATSRAAVPHLELINPLWSTQELRGRIERIDRETEDAATILIKPGWEWEGHQPGQYLRIGMADPLLAAAAGWRPGLHSAAARAGRPSPAGPLRRATNRRCRGLTASGRAAPSRRTDQTGGNGPAPDGTLGAQFPRERGGIPVSPLRPRQVFRKGFAAWSTCSISSALSNASGAGARLRAVRIAAACRASI